MGHPGSVTCPSKKEDRCMDEAELRDDDCRILLTEAERWEAREKVVKKLFAIARERNEKDE